MIQKHIPNLITCCSLFSGCVAIIFISHGRLELVPYLVILSGIFDFLDGFAARLLKVASDIGKELDSLSDMVSFGIVPAYFMYALISTKTSNELLPYLGFVIAIASALRLAKFNIDDRQSDGFLGLPTPANALFMVGLLILPMSLSEQLTIEVLVALSLLLSWLLVSELPLLALKFKNYRWQDNSAKYSVILASLALITAFGMEAISLVIVVYILISMFVFFRSKLTNK